MGNHGYKKPIISRKPSIQGEWHERIDLINLDFTISLPDIDELTTIKTVALTIKQEDEIFFLSVLVHTHNGNRVFENCSKIMLNNKAKCYGKRHPLQDRFVDLLRDLIKRKKNKTRASNKPAKLLGQLQQYASDL